MLQGEKVVVDKALYENIVVTITLQKGDQTHDVVLNKSNNWSGSLENLPVGEYTILENSGNAAGCASEHWHSVLFQVL